MIQMALVFTFEDGVSDGCLIDIINAYTRCANATRAVHGEVLLTSWAVYEPAMQQRFARITHDGCSEEERQRALDIWELARLEVNQRKDGEG